MAVHKILFFTVTLTNENIDLKHPSECMFVDDCHVEIGLKKFGAPLLPNKYGGCIKKQQFILKIKVEAFRKNIPSSVQIST